MLGGCDSTEQLRRTLVPISAPTTFIEAVTSGATESNHRRQNRKNRAKGIVNLSILHHNRRDKYRDERSSRWIGWVASSSEWRPWLCHCRWSGVGVGRRTVVIRRSSRWWGTCHSLVVCIYQWSLANISFLHYRLERDPVAGVDMYLYFYINSQKPAPPSPFGFLLFIWTWFRVYRWWWWSCWRSFFHTMAGHSCTKDCCVRFGLLLSYSLAENPLPIFGYLFIVSLSLSLSFTHISPLIFSIH